MKDTVILIFELEVDINNIIIFVFPDKVTHLQQAINLTLK